VNQAPARAGGSARPRKRAPPQEGGGDSGKGKLVTVRGGRGQAAAERCGRHAPVGRHARSHVTAGDLCLVPLFPLYAIDWAQEAAGFTFSLDQLLLGSAGHDLILGAIGELVWVRREETVESLTPAVHPALIMHTAADTFREDRVRLVAHLTARDPLLRHITLLLQAEIEAEGVADHLYAESLANALAMHLLRRYAAARQTGRGLTGNLSPD